MTNSEHTWIMATGMGASVVLLMLVALAMLTLGGLLSQTTENGPVDKVGSPTATWTL